MNTSPELKNIYTAIIKARPEIAPIARTKSAKNYKYATLDTVIELLSLVLPKHGLGWVQTLSSDNGKTVLVTRIIHESGEWIEDALALPQTKLNGGANDSQELGASITYFKRYALSAMFGIATDDDTDGVADVRDRKQQVKAQARIAGRPQVEPDGEIVYETAQSESNSHSQPVKPKKQDPLEYVKADLNNRMEAGDDPEQILKDYSNILKMDVKSIDTLEDKDITCLARALFVNNRNKGENNA